MEADNDGYVTELDYTYRYCPALSPSHIALACAACGIAFPQGRPLRYLEMAFGQGASLNIHATAAPGDYWGFDFNPRHVANAQALANAAGSGAHLTADSFESFTARGDLPQFDVIAMHGTWSWISQENRHLAVEIVRKRLAPGGVCLVSYNCLPGWADELPLRHLMAVHAQRAAATLPLGPKIEAALGFAQALADAGAKYFTAHPGLQAWLENLRSRSHNYLAHEYFNRDWHPMPSSEVARALAGAGLAFGAAATLAGTSDGVGLDAKARELVAGIGDPILRETVLDYFSNTRFRSDLFVNPGCAPDPRPLQERIGSIPFVLLHHPDYLPPSVRAGGLEIPLAPEVIRPLAAAMSTDGFSPKSLLEVGATPECAKIPPSQLAEAALVLTEGGYLHPAQSRDWALEATARCKRLNAEILGRAGAPNEISALASPVTGAGVFAARKEMAFLRALSLGDANPQDWARYAWETLGEGNPAALRSEADAFARVRLPVFKALGIA